MGREGEKERSINKDIGHDEFLIIIILKVIDHLSG